MNYCSTLEIGTIHERGNSLKFGFIWRTSDDFPLNSAFRPGVVKPPHFQPRLVNELGAAVDDLLEKIANFSRIFGLISTFLPYSEEFANRLEVKLYNFYKIIIDYGSVSGPGSSGNRDFSLIVNWNLKSSKFHLALGSRCQRKNPHSLIAAELNSILNSNENLAEVLQILVETFPVYEAVGRIWTGPSFTKDDFTTAKQSAPDEGVFEFRSVFALIPLNSTSFRLIFRSTFCLEFHCLSKGQVVVWDCGRAQEGQFKWSPLPGFASLLQKFGNVELRKPAPPPPPLKKDDPESAAGNAPNFRDPASIEPFSLASPTPMIPPSPLGAGIGPSGPLSVPNIPAPSPAQSATISSMGPMTPSPAPGSTQAPVAMSPAPPSVVGPGLTTPSPAPPGSQTSIGQHTGFTPNPSPAQGPASQSAAVPSPAGGIGSVGMAGSDFMGSWNDKEPPTTNKIQREDCEVDEFWAAIDFPIIIPHESLIKLCSVDPKDRISPLERYLSSLYMLMKLEPLYAIRSAVAVSLLEI